MPAVRSPSSWTPPIEPRRPRRGGARGPGCRDPCRRRYRAAGPGPAGQGRARRSRPAGRRRGTRARTPNVGAANADFRNGLPAGLPCQARADDRGQRQGRGADLGLRRLRRVLRAGRVGWHARRAELGAAPDPGAEPVRRRPAGRAVRLGGGHPTRRDVPTGAHHGRRDELGDGVRAGGAPAAGTDEGCGLLEPPRRVGIGLPGHPRAVLSTSDGGRTWHRTGALPATPYDAGFADLRQGWATRGGQSWLETIDGGRTWQPPASFPVKCLGHSRFSPRTERAASVGGGACGHRWFAEGGAPEPFCHKPWPVEDRPRDRPGLACGVFWLSAPSGMRLHRGV